jgi:hypothetical protein
MVGSVGYCDPPRTTFDVTTPQIMCLRARPLQPPRGWGQSRTRTKPTARSAAARIRLHDHNEPAPTALSLELPFTAL